MLGDLRNFCLSGCPSWCQLEDHLDLSASDSSALKWLQHFINVFTYFSSSTNWVGKETLCHLRWLCDTLVPQNLLTLWINLDCFGALQDLTRLNSCKTMRITRSTRKRSTSSSSTLVRRRKKIVTSLRRRAISSLILPLTCLTQSSLPASSFDNLPVLPQLDSRSHFSVCVLCEVVVTQAWPRHTCRICWAFLPQYCVGTLALEWWVVEFTTACYGTMCNHLPSRISFQLSYYCTLVPCYGYLHAYWWVKHICSWKWELPSGS